MLGRGGGGGEEGWRGADDGGGEGGSGERKTRDTGGWVGRGSGWKDGGPHHPGNQLASEHAAGGAREVVGGVDKLGKRGAPGKDGRPGAHPKDARAPGQRSVRVHAQRQRLRLPPRSPSPPPRGGHASPLAVSPRRSSLHERGGGRPPRSPSATLGGGRPGVRRHPTRATGACSVPVRSEDAASESHAWCLFLRQSWYSTSPPPRPRHAPHPPPTPQDTMRCSRAPSGQTRAARPSTPPAP